MATSDTPANLADVDWESSSIPRPIRLAMMDMRRERDDAVAERKSVTDSRARLQRDYDALRVEVQRPQAGLSNVGKKEVNTMKAEIAALEEKPVVMSGVQYPYFNLCEYPISAVRTVTLTFTHRPSCVPSLRYLSRGGLCS